jgi:murein DD-endopeptidase / murein LD-carboxypeptidase
MRLFSYSGILLLGFTMLAISCRHRKDLTKNHHTHDVVVGNENAVQEKLGVSNKEVKNSKLYSFVNDWYGAPYKYGGCKKTGVDCSCFTAHLVETVYGVKTGRTAGEIHKQCEKISTSKLRQGDLVFFIINGKNVSHVGIYLKNDKFVHASTSKGVIISDMNEAYYKKYFHSAGRLKLTL